MLDIYAKSEQADLTELQSGFGTQGTPLANSPDRWNPGSLPIANCQLISRGRTPLPAQQRAIGDGRWAMASLPAVSQHQPGINKNAEHAEMTEHAETTKLQSGFGTQGTPLANSPSQGIRDHCPSPIAHRQLISRGRTSLPAQQWAIGNGQWTMASLPAVSQEWGARFRRADLTFRAI